MLNTGKDIRILFRMEKLKFYLAVFSSIIMFFGCNKNMPEAVENAYDKLPDYVDFNYHVKPILSDKCFACHGPDTNNQKAGLRLDIPENAYEVLKSGKQAIVSKKTGKSEVIHRIFSEDPEVIMPPPEFNVPLTKKEMATIVKWIEQGAEYKPHWSFIKPKKSAVPEIKNESWVNNNIDYFVANTLEQKELSPSKRATKETLIRRLSFSLTGLPPTLNDIEHFVKDTSKLAYENLVDKFLESPDYGERMAANWLDVARYADSDGYLDDKHRDFSPWRDWVIHAFNQNMPYNEFATKQLAGDLLPNADKESILATAFNRLHKKNSEAGIVYEEYRAEYVADRTATVGKAFLGLSVECARCHDHKYDPISQKEHYQLSGFFNSTNEIGTAIYGPDQTPGPSLLLTDDEQGKLIAYLQERLGNQEKKLIKVKANEKENFNLWKSRANAIYNDVALEAKKGLVDYYPFDDFKNVGKGVFYSPSKVSSKKQATLKNPIIKEGAIHNAAFLDDYTSIKLEQKTGWFDHTDAFSISLSLFPDKVYDNAVVFHHSENIRLGLKGYSMYLEGNRLKFVMAFSWPTNAIEVVSTQPIPEKEWTNITISYNGSGKASGINIYTNGLKIPLETNIDNLYKSILFKPNVHTYGFQGLSFGNFFQIPSVVKSGVDEIKVYNKKLTGLEVLYHQNPKRLKDVLKKSISGKNEELLAEYYHDKLNLSARQINQNLQKTRKILTGHLDSIPEIMVLGDLPTPRPTYVLDRGAYDAHGEQVEPGVPEAVLPFNNNLPKNRLGLTQWLFDKDNPLTARVFVNRIWQMHFGKGIVASSEDFGNQGSLPSHPELLDWLAVTFMESGWDIKKLHKLIVMSSTYQQSSKVSKALLEIDTDNVLLARGPSYRLSAEMIRDNALAVSGLLSKKIGGRSVYPYQPKGLWDEISRKKWRYKYLQESDENLYRRSLYTIWKRSSPPPSMVIFDVGDRSVCSVKRRNTSTPLQALVLLNDPQFLEAHRVMAEHIISTHKNDSVKQLKQAFKLGVGRNPDSKELNLLQKFYKDEVNRFSTSKADASKYLSIGESSLKKDIDIVKTAALATVINGIMNTADSYTMR
ncbi:DUF1553 domain-containing protein [Postechiella marina]|uniref:DUF1553 domain-containing protein n=1 Tax=Postechiella marina TaxID=943941 RepID=A0ABP8C8M1_9FLAO